MAFNSLSRKRATTFTKCQKSRKGEWLNSELQNKLCHLKPDAAMMHVKLVDTKDYSYVPPRPIQVKVIRCSS